MKKNIFILSIILTASLNAVTVDPRQNFSIEQIDEAGNKKVIIISAHYDKNSNNTRKCSFLLACHLTRKLLSNSSSSTYNKNKNYHWFSIE